MNDTATTTTRRIDTRDMVVVHTALLREVRLGPDAVERAAASGSARHRTRTARHLTLIVDLLEHHHAGEDELLLPLLQARVPEPAVRAIDTGEEQHARIEGLIASARADLVRWTEGAPEVAPALVETLRALHAALEPHLRAEERDVLPLVETYLEPAEWQALGDAGFRSTPTSALVLVLGMFLYEGDPAVVRHMLAGAPAVARLLLPLIAPGVHARRCRAVHGTPRP